MNNSPQPHQPPAARRIAAELDGAGLQVRSANDEVSISGPTHAVDRLLDRVTPVPPTRDCDGQLHLFDPAPFTQLRSVEVA